MREGFAKKERPQLRMGGLEGISQGNFQEMNNPRKESSASGLAEEECQTGRKYGRN